MAKRVHYDWNYNGNNWVYGDDADVNYELRGYDGIDYLFGNEGDDLLLGGDGNDYLWGGDGDDVVRGGSGDDRLYIDRGDNHYDGGSGDDDMVFGKVSTFYSQVGPWKVWEYDIDFFHIGFNVDLSSGETRSQTSATSGYTDLWGFNTFENIQTVLMSSGNDVLRDNNAGHKLNGGSGDDIIEGRGGADTIQGSAGSDTASYESAGSRIYASLMTDTGMFDDAEGDTFESIENLIGSAYSDFLFGDDQANRITGGGGSDAITGHGGADTLIGGAGIDTFYYRALSDTGVSLPDRDTILDFVRNTDKINLRDLDANAATPSSGAFTTGDDAFDFIGQNRFTGIAGQLRYTQMEDASGTLFNRLEGDVNGDRVGDFIIHVYSGGQGLSSNDFYL